MKRAGQKVRVIVAEDHPLTRKGMLIVLRKARGVEIVGEADSTEELWTVLDKSAADILVLDIYLRGVNTLELIPRIRSRFPNLRVIVMSGFDDPVFVSRAIRRGAHGFVSKTAEAEQLAQAIRAVTGGQVYVLGGKFNAAEADILSGEGLSSSEDRIRKGLQKLTLREAEVFRLLGQWKNTAEIADILGMSAKTVEIHRMHIKNKLGVSSAAELVRLAVEWGGRSVPANKHG